ncbi:MAG: bifunctional UDP-N-acetylglucosamine diphosphorylase/glucosamine-1-phosphate N-acetyltransferase GlmU, partial [Deltaproteobacteria bacterium]
MKELAAIILAAGKGTRMKSKMPKVLHRVAGSPMLCYPLSILKGLRAKRVIVVVGHGAAEVRAAFADEPVEFVTQSEQLGTGHAVMRAVRELPGFRGDILILSGDVPLITKETIKALRTMHRGASLKKKPALSMVTALLEDPRGYGRVVRDENGAVVRVVEDRDCSPLQKDINEVNAGIYLASSGFLLENIGKVNNRNAQGEYYLPDLIGLAVKSGEKVSALTHLYPEEVFGINNRVELALADKIMRKRAAKALMLGGVTIIDPDAAYIDAQVRAGMDTVIYPGVHLIGDTVIGENCVIEENVRIKDSSVGDNSTVKSHSIIEESEAGKEVSIGPFARLRPGSVIKDRARIGNFVEVKKTVVGRGSKANHLTYLGDSVIGEGVNIGAG